MKRYKIVSLIVCILMMCATAMIVNRSIFGISLDRVEKNNESAAQSDSIVSLGGGEFLVNTASLTDAQGYAVPVPLTIRIKDGVIEDVEALPNAETPGFFRRASAILGEWKGKSVEEAAKIHPDAVSGATYSSEAIKANVEAGLECWLQDPSVGGGSGMPWKLWVAFGVTLAACVVPLFFKNKIYHRLQLVANIIVLGFWCGQFLDYALILKWLSSGMALPACLIAILMLTAAFIYPLFGRPQYYCTHICPLGSAQELVAEICRYKIKISPRVIKGLDWFRRILWAVLMLALWMDIWKGWMDLELFQAFMFESAPVGVIIAAVLFVALSAVVSRPYCRFVCPTGSLFKRAENIG